MPIACLCSKARHIPGFEIVSSDMVHNFSKTLDLHTFEAPITTSHYDLTADQIGLQDLTIDGALNLYAVTRDSSESDLSSRGPGKDALFMDEEHWVS
jgi:hypothetical protein